MLFLEPSGGGSFGCAAKVSGAGEREEDTESADGNEDGKDGGMGAESLRPQGGGDDEEPTEHGDGDQREPKLPGQGWLGCGGHGIIFCLAGARSNWGQSTGNWRSNGMRVGGGKAAWMRE